MQEQTPLYQKLARLIWVNGPISLAEYFYHCLADPEHGYYQTREAIGGRGDFVTAPEISQIFGELIGFWCLDCWQKLGRPIPFCLAEFGPGCGSLIADALRALAGQTGFLSAMQLVLVENSPKLQVQQEKALSGIGFGLARVKWCQEISQLPQMPLIAIANEFLDALPFHQFVKKGAHFVETGVGLDESENLVRVLLPAMVEADLLPVNAADEAEGAVFEIAPARQAFIAGLADHISQHQGAALLIDYGHEQSGFGDTFQAVRDHKPCNPFEAPGEADLTSHVDFGAIRRELRRFGIENAKLTNQGEFLLTMGLLERAGVLGANARPEQQEKLHNDVERLAGPQQMGKLFKVLAFSIPPIELAGFAV